MEFDFSDLWHFGCAKYSYLSGRDNNVTYDPGLKCSLVFIVYSEELPMLWRCGLNKDINRFKCMHLIVRGC